MSRCGWALSRVALPCVAQRVWPMPQLPAGSAPSSCIRRLASLPMSLITVRIPSGADYRDAGAVIAAVLETTEAVQDDGDRFRGADVAHDATHGASFRRTSNGTAGQRCMRRARLQRLPRGRKGVCDWAVRLVVKKRARCRAARQCVFVESSRVPVCTHRNGRAAERPPAESFEEPLPRHPPGLMASMDLALCFQDSPCCSHLPRDECVECSTNLVSIS